MIDLHGRRRKVPDVETFEQKADTIRCGDKATSRQSNGKGENKCIFGIKKRGSARMIFIGNEHCRITNIAIELLPLWSIYKRGNFQPSCEVPSELCFVDKTI